MSSFPDDRGWNPTTLYHPDPDHRGTSTTDQGGFLYDAAEFDAAFFGVAPRDRVRSGVRQSRILVA
ncbi:hypothetical protein GFY24_40350 [Nocardia sp. SYP-A9097]|uniref:beta-ketoacyl synthase N-terminal-like domain-containing protein n=1 Tax=Nocardia sp. SYP-A9097 TaxID=2663237 RepID=UPI00129B2EA8|nr:hypothetical protein [Nocardia sp. SYP-A9097]